LAAGTKHKQTTIRRQRTKLADLVRLIDHGRDKAEKERALPLDVVLLEQTREHRQGLAAHQLVRVVKAQRDRGDVLVHQGRISFFFYFFIFSLTIKIMAFAFGPIPNAQVTEHEHDVVADDGVLADSKFAGKGRDVLLGKLLVEQADLSDGDESLGTEGGAVGRGGGSVCGRRDHTLDHREHLVRDHARVHLVELADDKQAARDRVVVQMGGILG